jgi:protein arginine kinase activator
MIRKAPIRLPAAGRFLPAVSTHRQARQGFENRLGTRKLDLLYIGSTHDLPAEGMFHPPGVIEFIRRQTTTMECEACHQRQATLRRTEVVEKKVTTIHLCEECAKAGDGSLKPPPSSALVVVPMAQEQELRELFERRCPICGLSYSEFRTRGRLGCANDYVLFRKGLIPLLEKIHGKTQHEGKVSSRAGSDLAREKRLQRLREELKAAVKREAYEEAAKIRDQIRSLEREPKA